MKSKKLSLKKEVLAELSNEEMSQVAGAGFQTIDSYSCYGVCPTSDAQPSCHAECELPSNPLYSCPTLNGCTVTKPRLTVA